MGALAELNKIKKTYGERFMKMCREYFPTILEKEGELFNILTSTFANNSKTLYEDIRNNNCESKFKNYIYDRFNNGEKTYVSTKKTPYELLDEAGYELVECENKSEIQAFRKYYCPGEELCTFIDEQRLDFCLVFFAVKKNVDSIKRENFKIPKREDEYGTSVISIQFTKEKNSTLSIKNRYNHVVDNPDATFGNDLERIIPGLTESFEKLLLKRGLKLTRDNLDYFEIPGYVIADDGKYYKYNIGVDGVYFCPGNIIIEHGNVTKLENPEKQMLIDYFVVDREKKNIKVADLNLSGLVIIDSFVDDFKDIEKIDVVNDKEGRNGEKIIFVQKKNYDKPLKITVNKQNEIVGYENERVEAVEDNFLVFNEKLRELNLSRLKRAGDSFMFHNKSLEKVNLSNLEKVKNGFLYENEAIETIELPNLKKVDSNFLRNNEIIKSIKIDNLEMASDGFLHSNNALEELCVSKLEQVGNDFLNSNNYIKKLNAPKLAYVGDNFLNQNKALKELELEKLEECGNNFLYYNDGLENLKCYKLRNTGNYFLPNNKKLHELELPNLENAGDFFGTFNANIRSLKLPAIRRVGSFFLMANKNLKDISLPNLKFAGNYFISNNQCVEKVEMPNLEKVRHNFLESNKKLEDLKLPCLKKVGDFFVRENESIKKVDMPNLEETGDDFLSKNNSIEYLELPELKKAGSGFLNSNEVIERIETPKLKSNDGINSLKEKIKNRCVTSKKIAELDKENNITTSEINSARESINELSREQEKESNER